MAERPAGFLDVVRTEEFATAWRRVNERPMTFREFSKLPMPAGMSAEELWSALAVLRREQGVRLTVKPLYRSAADFSWTSVPRSSEEELRRLASLAGDDSPVARRVAQGGPSDRALVPFVLEDVHAALRRDGLVVPWETLRALWHHAKAPSSPQERVVANLRRLLQASDTYAARPITMGLACEVRAELAFGVDLAAAGLAGQTRPRQFDETLYPPERLDSEEYSAQRLLAVNEQCEQGGFDAVVIAGIELSSTFWNAPPFDALNSLVELVLRRAFFQQRGCAALGFVPLTSLVDENRGSLTRDFETEHWALRGSVGTTEGIDATIYYMGMVSLYLTGMRRLRDAVEDAQAELEAAGERVRGLSTANRRQSDFLLGAAANPDAVHTISAYVEQYGVAYATARHDLMDLADRGLLTMGRQGRAFVFRLAPGAI